MRKTFKSHKRVIRGSVSDLPSMTVPGDTYSIKDLVKKHLNGQILPGHNNQGIYYGNGHDDEDLEKISRSDIVDKNNYAVEHAVKLQKIKTHLEEKEQKIRKQRSSRIKENVENEHESTEAIKEKSDNPKIVENKKSESK